MKRRREKTERRIRHAVHSRTRVFSPASRAGGECGGLLDMHALGVDSASYVYRGLSQGWFVRPEKLWPLDRRILVEALRYRRGVSRVWGRGFFAKRGCNAPQAAGTRTEVAKRISTGFGTWTLRPGSTSRDLASESPLPLALSLFFPWFSIPLSSYFFHAIYGVLTPGQRLLLEEAKKYFFEKLGRGERFVHERRTLHEGPR